MGDCTFCRIVAGDLAAHRLYQDDRTTAFLDAHPAVEGHALVVPNAHVEALFSTPGASRAVFRAVETVADAMDRVLDPEGFSTFYTSGHLVGQVDHAHAHLVPRQVDDGITFALSRRPLDEESGGDLAARIRRAT